MTKAEELKILEQIEGLIESAGADSYIRMTFAGVPEICRRNIENDFGDIPVQDLEDMWIRVGVVERDRDEKNRMLAEPQKMCKEALDENEGLRKQAEEWEQNAHDSGELYAELEAECAELSAEVRKLKAEIVRMRMERMTEDDMALMYVRMRGDFDD